MTEGMKALLPVTAELERAREIAADAIENSAFGADAADKEYARIMRMGYFDNDRAVQAALAAIIETRRQSHSLPRDVGMREALEKAKLVFDAMRQTSFNGWWVSAPDPEKLVCDAASAIDAALIVSGESCPHCDDSGYQEFSSGGLMGGPVKVTRKFCDCSCGQDARDQAAGVGMHAALTPSALSGDAGEGELPADVRRLVIAAREIAFNVDQESASEDWEAARRELDAASEAFASRVAWEAE